MKKMIVFAVGLFLVGATFAMAATKKAAPQVVKASQDTRLTYAGVEIFVPAGQSLVLGQDDNGYIVVRGNDLNGVRIGKGTIAANGPVTLSYIPQADIAIVNNGSGVVVTDPDGRSAELSQGAAVTAQDIRIPTGPTMRSLVIPVEGRASVLSASNSYNVSSQKTAATPVQQIVTQEDDIIPAFVAQSAVESAAYEQAEQDVLETETTLSPSAPR